MAFRFIARYLSFPSKESKVGCKGGGNEIIRDPMTLQRRCLIIGKEELPRRGDERRGNVAAMRSPKREEDTDVKSGGHAPPPFVFVPKEKSVG